MLKIFIKIFKLDCTYKKVLYRKGSPANGIVKMSNGKFAVYKSGLPVYNSPVLCTIVMTNGLMRAGSYELDAYGFIKHPNDPITVNGKRQSEITAKINQEKAKLKAKSEAKNAACHRDNHYKVSNDRLTYDTSTNSLLEKLWVRKENLAKLYYDSKASNEWHVVNFIRHRASNYDRILAEAKRWSPGNDAHKVIKTECLHLIGKVYPGLKTTCDKMAESII